MGSHRDRLKVILFQLRENDEVKTVDHRSFLRASKLGAEQLVAFDVLAKAPDESVLHGANAIIIGGSKHSVWDGVPNLPQLIAVLRAAREKKIPVLGVCFGAQLIAHAFGGQVVRDDAHQEWGTFEVETTDEAWTDMLLADAPIRFLAQCAHHDKIVKLPPTAVLLASSKKCQTQAFVIPGTDIYAFQFHPERSKADYETLLAMKGKDYSADQSGLEAVKASLKETPDAEPLIAKFIDRIVLQR